MTTDHSNAVEVSHNGIILAQSDKVLFNHHQIIIKLLHGMSFN